MSDPIRWQILLRSAPESVFSMLATRAGREAFWAAEAPEVDGRIRFTFGDGTRLDARVLASEAPRLFRITYFDESEATFELASRDTGTRLTLEETGVARTAWLDNYAGWVSLLLNLKAATDFGVDLRNHVAGCSWDAGYVDV